MAVERRVRDATAVDAAACADIYGYYVRETAITFETAPPSPAQMAARIEAALQRHAWLVLEDPSGAVIGYAYAHDFAERAAYRWAVETSVYLRTGVRRTGAGRLLYEALLQRLTERGYRRVTAGITLPNDASVGLHRALGFEHAGVLSRVGWKDGAWHDVARLQRSIGSERDPPAEPH